MGAIKNADEVADVVKGIVKHGDEAADAVKGTAKLSKRDELLNSVQNDKLKNSINEIYRPGATTGDGGLADAVRH